MRLMIYPNDPNGDVLRRIEADGDNLTRWKPGWKPGTDGTFSDIFIWPWRA